MPIYCLDTNIFLQAWNEYYSFDIAPGYWNMIDELAQQGIVFAPMEVKYELDKKDDSIKERIKARPYIFRDIDDPVQEHLTSIMQSHPRLVDSITGRSAADPWIIAFALRYDAIVVTKETLSTSSQRIRIPNVCLALGIPCIDDFQLVKQLGITFDSFRRDQQEP